MSNAVAPPPAPTVPTYPALGASNFNTLAYTFGTAMPGVSAGLFALADNAYTNATVANHAAATAITSANTASSASSVAVGAANFKGMWSSLTGALSRPACVKHNGRFWLLLADLPNVTLSEPTTGNAAWTTLDSGTEITQQVTTNTQAISGVHYIITASGVTITALAGPVKGDWFKVTYTATPYTCYLNFNGAKFRGQTTSGSYRINGKAISRRYQYEDTTVGYV